MRPPPVSIADLPAWIRDQEKRLRAVECELGSVKSELKSEMRRMTNLLALSKFGVRLPCNAERDDRLGRLSRIPWPRHSKAGGHL